MSAYFIVDVDDLIEYLQAQTLQASLADVAISLRTTAALAAGLMSPNELVAIAVSDWNQHHRPNANGVHVQQVFVSAGYDLFNVTQRKFVVDALLTHYFPIDKEAEISEMIVATSQQDLLILIDRMNIPPFARVRVWSDIVSSNSNAQVIFQPLENILGVKTKSVGLYVDFENITISLNEQGYIVDFDVLLGSLKTRARQYGEVVHMAAYAPWGQRGSLPPMLDAQGREISDDVPSRLALESIDPVFSLPGKNSADLRIAKDLLAETTGPNSPDVIIIASGDRDFNDIYNALRARGKQVIVWGVHGSTSKVLENNTSITLDYVEDFTPLRLHKELETIFSPKPVEQVPTHSEESDFRPSQWSSVVVQYDLLISKDPHRPITRRRLAGQLVDIHATTNKDRSDDLINQALQLGILERYDEDVITVNSQNQLVEKTRLIRDHVVYRVVNTLNVRQWEYVNYGFLLKGIAMDDRLMGDGLNTDDNWRSEWIDFLVREGVLLRELIPHRHNPDDLVPVIRVPTHPTGVEVGVSEEETDERIIYDMARRIIISVEQFTSFRQFAWCPLGSLHKRLKNYDVGAAFQQAVESLEDEGAIDIREYPNPQSDFFTKGISLVYGAQFVQEILGNRNDFIETLLNLYNNRVPITAKTLNRETGLSESELEFWVSIMELENVLNPVSGHPGVYSLFRTHHTVSIIAGD